MRKPDPVPFGCGSERKPGGTTELMTVTTDGRVSWYTRTVVSVLVAAAGAACCAVAAVVVVCGAVVGAVTIAGLAGLVTPTRGVCPSNVETSVETFEMTGCVAWRTLAPILDGPATT